MEPVRRRQLVAPIFLPHAGCPFQCVYCNQFLLGGPSARGGKDPVAHVEERLQERAEWALRTPDRGEIAFFGGTFTSLPRESMIHVLEKASVWVRKGVFTGIRFSTRPDSISEEVCRVLGNYPVQTVELGAQSMSDAVLRESRRGYLAADVARAAEQIRENGWILGVQLMPGLPGDTRERFVASVEGVARLGPRFVRLYPTLVLEGTPLANWHSEGRYLPLSLDAALSWCAQAYEVFRLQGVALARAGLHADVQRGDSGSIRAGPYHPAFGYLVRVRWWRERVDWLLPSPSVGTRGKKLTVGVPARRISEALGPGRSNAVHWKTRWALEDVRVRGLRTLEDHRLEIQLQ